VIPVTWVPREPPLRPVGVAAWGPAGARLAERLRACTDEQLQSWTGVQGEGILLVLGEDLPWADGVLWLGRDPAAPGLLLPTAMRPTAGGTATGGREPSPADPGGRAAAGEPGVELLARALARFGPSLAVIPELRRVVPLLGARPIARERLP
jgi:hypothetical protein